jgi:hypothetical protein
MGKRGTYLTIQYIVYFTEYKGRSRVLEKKALRRIFGLKRDD